MKQILQKYDDPIQAEKWLMTGLILAALGALVHDMMEFGRPSEQNTIPFVVIGGLLWWVWRAMPTRRRGFLAALLVLTVVMMFGAIASVLPLAFWPWVPEQTLWHYLVHLIWTSTLIILLVTIVRQWTLLTGGSPVES